MQGLRVPCEWHPPCPPRGPPTGERQRIQPKSESEVITDGSPWTRQFLQRHWLWWACKSVSTVFKTCWHGVYLFVCFSFLWGTWRVPAWASREICSGAFQSVCVSFTALILSNSLGEIKLRFIFEWPELFLFSSAWTLVINAKTLAGTRLLL